MFDPKILTPVEKREAKRIERIKRYDEERKARIFNARQRLIGVDVEALESQIQEKKALEEAELAEQKALYMKEINDNHIVDNIQRQVEQNKKIVLSEINRFRMEHQRKEDRREFDLNDPDALKKSLPCRIGDNDPRLTISSVQKFEGEDSAANERDKIKKEQQRNWLVQQIVEKRNLENQRKQSDKLLLETIKTRDSRAQLMDQLNRDCRRQIELATVAYNQALSYEQAMERKLKEQMEKENNKAEINNALTSDLLCENTDVAQSNLGLGKQVGALYKGMSEREKNEILKIQEKQREELRAKKEEEVAHEKYWLDFTNRLNKNIHFMDLEKEVMKREELKMMYKQNEALSREQKLRREYLNKVVYTNTPTAAFYNQFNKTTR
ncbi:RIB43A-like with coiled-coils protein 2 [Halyomorpha halys]|uniref:RIB43A-like with coiled-coils protein 2 n=1 Tax=Halyomorpha halys TaxID=286706 RepID=UPI0006D51BE8|nr:RIB43A-like with coiled-coils protein 2 [Halyomorpha halys]